MKSNIIWILLWVSILTGGALLRFIDLNARPMHTDESVHAEKFGRLLEDNYYRYDKHEFHGPTLNYCTLASAFLRGERTYSQIEEKTLRLVPACFGVLLILTPLFFVRGLGKPAVFFAATLLAFSPAVVYYSRYYIQEMLLVFFTACFLGCVYQYVHRRTVQWVVFAGCFLGLMHATKETFVFSIAAASLAAFITVWRYRPSFSFRLSHIVAGLISFAIVSCAFFSSFGANRQGIADSLATYGIWMQRAGGQSVHVHPWYYYLDLLTWMEFIEPLTWNEDGIVALASIGIAVLLTRKAVASGALAHFLALYTLLLMVVYSGIPYKTPWSMLSFLFGMALVAGWMAQELFRLARNRGVKTVFAAMLLLCGFFSPAVQSKFLAFDFAADPANPYVYAHTDPDIFRMIKDVRTTAYASHQGKDVAIYIVAEGDDYWPLPWYLRDFSNVGYVNHVDSSIAEAPLILAQSRLEQPLLKMLYSAPPPGKRYLYFPLFDPSGLLRPGVYWQGYIRKDLWDSINEQTQIEDISRKDKANLMDIQSGKDDIPNVLKFSHGAMNTTFEIFVQHENPSYAAAAAKAAFDVADRLESRLSRFIENSDISRVNSTIAGQTVVVDPDTMHCLLIAQKSYKLTGGAFDITIGKLTLPENTQNISQISHQALQIELSPETLDVKRLNPDAQVDLGGIGKGYAVDKMAEVLSEWSITKGLVHGGASSVIALQPPDGKSGWPITLSDPATGKRVMRLELKNEVLSSSGLTKGSHIIDPATGQPVQSRLAVWVRLPQDAALADVLSTAAMIMPLEKLFSLQQTLQGCSMKILTTEKGQPEWLTAGDRFTN